MTQNGHIWLLKIQYSYRNIGHYNDLPRKEKLNCCAKETNVKFVLTNLIEASYASYVIIACNLSSLSYLLKQDTAAGW
jgi:hypothetical protein